MPKRHALRSGDWESIVTRLEELVLANSGEDEFEEIFKLLIAKLFSEKATRADSFCLRETPSETADMVNDFLAQACRRWDGILTVGARSRLTDEHLVVCVEAMQSLALADSNLEVLDALFEHLVNRASKGNKGQFFTPRHVIDCCVRLLNPQPGESIADPACGSGGFLVHALNYVRAQSRLLPSVAPSNPSVWGFDFDARAVRVAKALMLVAGESPSNIVRLNSLLTPVASATLFDDSHDNSATPRIAIEDVMRIGKRNFRGFDIILTNPPFAGEVREEHLLQQYELARGGRKIERDVLFIERCVQLLRVGGRIAIVLPHNKVASPQWAYAREWLARRVRIVGVLGLGRNTFLPHTHQKTSVIIGIKRPKTATSFSEEEVLFVVSERAGKDSAGQLVVRPEAQIDETIWERADHDLGEVVDLFRTHLKRSAIEWSAA